MPDLDVVGLAEVAEILGLTRQATHQRLVRGQLPEPDARLASGPVWWRSTILAATSPART